MGNAHVFRENAEISIFDKFGIEIISIFIYNVIYTVLCAVTRYGGQRPSRKELFHYVHC